MILIKIIGIALVTVVAALLVKPYKGEYAFIISLAGGTVCFFLAVGELEGYISAVSGLFADSGVAPYYFSVALRAVGIGYITEFAADTAKDAGQSAVASKIIFAGKICMFILALPLIKNLLSLATELVGK